MADSADMRASDSDRERIAEILRDAAAEGRLGLDELDERLSAVYAAKTYGELEPIVQDLPAAGGATAAPDIRAARTVATASAGPTDRFGGEPTSTAAVAVMSGFSRKGSWVVPSCFTAVAFMGGGEIDMHDARFAERDVTIRVFAVMGGVGITVPEDADVRVSGFGLMGGFDHGPTQPPVAGGPVIRIKGLAFWGGVGVKRRTARSDARRRKEELRQEMRSRADEFRARHEEIRDEIRARHDELKDEIRARHDELRAHRHHHRRELRQRELRQREDLGVLCEFG
jgi:hypothetical protein